MPDTRDTQLAVRLLLAGSQGPERVPPRPDPEQARWFEPLHVRAGPAARERIAAQVAAGADVVVAPTWLTHRRALLPVGESRRARTWTTAAVRIARQAVELGLERREEALAATAADDDDAGLWRSRPAPLVAASLPDLDAAPEPGSGRLLPREAATERDYHDQAGSLADAEPDLLLVEGQATIPELRSAVAAAVATGLDTWVALSGIGPGGRALTPALELTHETGVRRVLLPPGAPRDRLSVGPGWGILADPATLTSAHEVEAWLDEGAGIIGLLDGATPEGLQPLRAAIDGRERAEAQAAQRAEQRWQAHVEQAAAMAPRGSALWLRAQAQAQLAPAQPAPAQPPSPASLPQGFDWLILDHDRARGLPEDHFRLIVDAVGGAGAATRWRVHLVHGGIIALPSEPSMSSVAGMRVLVVDDSGVPPLAIVRRER